MLRSQREQNTNKQNKLTLKVCALKTNCPANSVVEGVITRSQLGITNSEYVLFAYFGLAYTTGSFYQGLDISFLIGEGAGNTTGTAVAYKIYNNNASAFSGVEFTARCLVYTP